MASRQPAADARSRWWLAVGVLVAGAAWCFWQPVEERLTAFFLFQQELPNEVVFRSLVDHSKSPTALIERAWNSGTVAQRQMAARVLRDWASTNVALDASAQRVVRQAALDVDVAIREIAFPLLADRKSPDQQSLAKEQLRDIDPEIRLLALRQFRSGDPALGVVAAASLLDDPDLTVIASAAAALRRWTGQDFGVRFTQAMPRVDETGRDIFDPAKLAALRQGIGQWKNWWNAHQSSYPKLQLANPVPGRLRTSDFSLRDLRGSSVRLSDFRGKVVLMNFWTTWCVACQEDIPTLNELQRRSPNQLVVLGISLDGVPDEHGHIPGAEMLASVAAQHGEDAEPSWATVVDVVGKTVQRRQIQYRVLLDPKNQVGGRFRGGELPTNVLIDGQGFVRRRFVGPRNVDTLQAMVAEIAPSARR